MRMRIQTFKTQGTPASFYTSIYLDVYVIQMNILQSHTDGSEPPCWNMSLPSDAQINKAQRKAKAAIHQPPCCRLVFVEGWAWWGVWFHTHICEIIYQIKEGENSLIIQGISSVWPYIFYQLPNFSLWLHVCPQQQTAQTLHKLELSGGFSSLWGSTMQPPMSSEEQPKNL